jgi:hypothetical protein
VTDSPPDRSLYPAAWLTKPALTSDRLMVDGLNTLSKTDSDYPSPRSRLAKCFGDRLLDQEINLLLLEHQFARCQLDEHITVIAPSSHLRIRKHFA